MAEETRQEDNAGAAQEVPAEDTSARNPARGRMVKLVLLVVALVVLVGGGLWFARYESVG